MAASEWFEVYRSYESAELADEITQLKKDLKGGYAGQGVGSVSHQRDLGQLRDRLAAAVRVKNERAHSNQSQLGSVDFGSVGWGDL